MHAPLPWPVPYEEKHYRCEPAFATQSPKRTLDTLPGVLKCNLARAQARVLIKSVKPIISWLGLDPLCQGTLRHALVVGLVIVHPLLEQHRALAIPDR
jgi:hypothetical protein